MTKLPGRRSFLLATAFVASALVAVALTPTEWEHRQPVNVAAPGLVKLAVPAATYEAAQPGLADVRLIGPDGREIPYLQDAGGALRTPTKTLTPGPVRTSSENGATRIQIETATSEPLDEVELQTSAPYFLKAVHAEVSADGSTWESAGAAVPVFRQFGAEQLRVPLLGKPAAQVRLTFDDVRSRPAAFEVKLRTRSAQGAATAPTPVTTRILRQEEFAGESVLTLELASAQVPLAELRLDVKDALFMRGVTVTVREFVEGALRERIIGGGTIYRVALDGSTTREQLSVPISDAPPSRELIVTVVNGDSPPLAVAGAEARMTPVSLRFLAPAAGGFALLSGNPQATAPHYDLSAFSGELRRAEATAAVAGPIEPTPNFAPRVTPMDPALADVSLTGAPLNTDAWRVLRPVRMERTGVEELELDAAALAGAKADYGDLRLVQSGNQIPYLLERPALKRTLTLASTVVPDLKRPSVTIWRLTLPQPGMPLEWLSLSSSTPLFQRQLRVYEKRTGPDGGTYEATLATNDWSRTLEPGVAPTQRLRLSDRAQGATLWLETDNGDNPAITITSVRATYPVVRLVFKAGSTEGLSLAYGNQAAVAPRYDLTLVAARLLTSSRTPAVLSGDIPEEKRGAGSFLRGIKGGPIFWGALALVVVVLLVVVAKLLPKPK